MNVNPAIELLRGIAAIMVMLCHYAVLIQDVERSWLNFLFTGVNFFFVISGFVFAPLLLSPARENTTAFAIRRTFRIYPLYLFAIIFYALLPQKTWDNNIILQHALFLHTTVSKEIAFYYNPAFWSLPVEVEFYLLIGLLVFLKIRNVTLVLLFLSGLSLLTVLWANHFLPEDSYLKLVLSCHLSSILPEFLLGTLAYLVSKNCDQLQGFLYGIAGLLLLFVLGHGFVVHGNAIVGMTFGFFNLLSALGYQWIIIAGVVFLRHAQSTTVWILVAGIMGNLSYGVYLFHNAIPPLMNKFFEFTGITLFIVSILITFVISAIMYQILENPMRKFGRCYAKRFYQSKS
ncbi:acyltransferase family protein [Nitrosomonas sp. ANs5]|uniref:acyltransferase family protein n=1 Tax=Nitrosomonas sp. ANs5 TaxID=3423941 RepID=UPI003D34F648